MPQMATIGTSTRGGSDAHAVRSDDVRGMAPPELGASNGGGAEVFTTGAPGPRRRPGLRVRSGKFPGFRGRPSNKACFFCLHRGTSWEMAVLRPQSRYLGGRDSTAAPSSHTGGFEQCYSGRKIDLRL